MKKFLIYASILLLSQILIAKKTDKAIQTEKVKEHPYKKMIERLKHVTNEDEYYKTHLFIAKKMYDGTDAEPDLVEALKHCAIAREGKTTKKEARKLFNKIITELLLNLASEPRDVKIKIDPKDFAEFIIKILDEVLEDMIYDKLHKDTPSQMYA